MFVVVVQDGLKGIENDQGLVEDINPSTMIPRGVLVHDGGSFGFKGKAECRVKDLADGGVQRYGLGNHFLGRFVV